MSPLTLQHILNDPTSIDRLRNEFRAQVYLKETELDDYFEGLGEVVEQHPIVSAGIRRG